MSKIALKFTKREVKQAIHAIGRILTILRNKQDRELQLHEATTLVEFTSMVMDKIVDGSLDSAVAGGKPTLKDVEQGKTYVSPNIDFQTYAKYIQDTAIYPSIIEVACQRIQKLAGDDPEAAKAVEVFRKHDDGSNPYYVALGLAGEAGEICNKLKKVMRDSGGIMTDKTRADLFDENGDLLWYNSQFAKELNTSLPKCAAWNLIKLRSRKVRDKLKGAGDDR